MFVGGVGREIEEDYDFFRYRERECEKGGEWNEEEWVWDNLVWIDGVIG